jgi:hypothetical protein
MPRSDNAEPIRAKDLNDNDDPMCEKSSTAIEDPIRTKLLKDKDEPSAT